jgi:hypothetical protein
VLSEPVERDIEDIRAIFAEIDRLGGADFLPEGRLEQPPMTPPRGFATDDLRNAPAAFARQPPVDESS